MHALYQRKTQGSGSISLVQFSREVIMLQNEGIHKQGHTDLLETKYIFIENADLPSSRMSVSSVVIADNQRLTFEK